MSRPKKADFEAEVKEHLDAFGKILTHPFNQNDDHVRAVLHGITASVVESSYLTPSQKVRSIKAALEAADRLIEEFRGEPTE